MLGMAALNRYATMLANYDVVKMSVDELSWNQKIQTGIQTVTS